MSVTYQEYIWYPVDNTYNTLFQIFLITYDFLYVGISKNIPKTLICFKI